jgi:hypothetical protein
VFESTLESCPVRLDNFEGPLDLLLHLIKKQEINVYDIPIAAIAQQYLAYLALMQELDLELAGDFLVMAATLIHIKSRMLLPRPSPEQEDPLEDPRDVLVRRLIEHQRYKAAAELLHERETVRSAQWHRPDERVANLAGAECEPELDVDLFSLLSAGPPAPAGHRSGQASLDRDANAAVAGPALGARRERLRGPVRGHRDAGRPGRDVSRDPRADPAEARARVPGRSVRSHPRLQAGRGRSDRAASRRRRARRGTRVSPEAKEPCRNN